MITRLKCSQLNLNSLTSVGIFFILFRCTSFDADMENLLNNQEVLWLLIISFYYNNLNGVILLIGNQTLVTLNG